MNWSDIAAAAATLFFVMDPLGNIPIFNAMLSRFPPRRRAQITARELVIALVILSMFLFTGTAILDFLGLTQPSLNIAGGVLLFLIALRMIFPRASAEAASESEEPFIVPLAMPLVAGPSTIAILLLLSSTEPERIWEWAVALVVAWAATTVLLTASPFLLRVLGSRGLRALERLMGMLLVLLATQMLLNGIREFVRSLAV
jgi:multiple antibiotic resistance protein